LTRHLGSGLAWGGGRGGRNAAPHRVARRKGRMPRGRRKTEDKSSDAGEVPSSRQRGKRCRGERALKKKMLINDEGSRNVYENKQKDDNLVEEKGDISTQRNNILHKSTGILLKPSGFFIVGALGNEPHASKCGNSMPRLCQGILTCARVGQWSCFSTGGGVRSADSLLTP